MKKNRVRIAAKYKMFLLHTQSVGTDREEQLTRVWHTKSAQDHNAHPTRNRPGNTIQKQHIPM